MYPPISDSLALVWGESVNDLPPAGPPGVSFSLWSTVAGTSWLQWKPGKMPDLANKKVFLVNLFHTPDSTHAQQIRARYPQAYIIVSPDPLIDQIMAHPEWTNMIEQMKIADLIACRTTVECQIYHTLLGKPTAYLSSPIGPDDWYMPYRSIAKENFILALDHGFSPNYTMLNVAALAQFQRDWGRTYAVLYASEREWTRKYAQQVGLKAEFLGNVPFLKMTELTAKARVCLDLYTCHSVGRQAILCAAVGTPIITSKFCVDAPGTKIDPFCDVSFVAPKIASMHNDFEQCQAIRNAGFERVKAFSFSASRERLEKIVGEHL